MAATEITVTRVEKEKVVAIPTTAAVDTADGASVDWNCADGKLLLIVENADSAACKACSGSIDGSHRGHFIGGGSIFTKQ